MWELAPSWEMYELHSSADLQQCFQYWKSPTAAGSGYLCCLKSLATGCPGREGNSSVVHGRHPSSAEQQEFACVSFVCFFSTTSVALHSYWLLQISFLPIHAEWENMLGTSCRKPSSPSICESGPLGHEIPSKPSCAISLSEI